MSNAAFCPECNAAWQAAPVAGSSYQCPECGRVFDAVPPEDAIQAATVSLAPNIANRYPSLPGYQIVESIGKGGMGQVYLAMQLKLDRLVAIKVIRSDLLSDRSAVKRFQREAKAVARLAHPNVVAIFDADEA